MSLQGAALPQSGLTYVTRRRDTLLHTGNDIKERLEKADHELRVIKIAQDALIEKTRVILAEVAAAQVENHSPMVLVEVCAVTAKKKKWKAQLHSLSSLDVKNVEIVLIVLERTRERGGLETVELDQF